ncbi:MAG: hypothetical protein IIA68_10965 [Proteobacteria bacterium]|nr:hypothetical protein [Pseudomonadota bacterium]
MRDGTRLATDVFRPDAPGRFPVLVNRGPYGKDIYIDNPDHSTWFFPKYGYVLLSQDCRARFGGTGDFLFGRFGAADAFYAPVATRFVTYGVALEGAAADYRDALVTRPDLRQWIAAAKAEPWVIEEP